MHASDSDPIFITALLNSTAYPHRILNIELLQTHISWVLLTGDYAYKIKKPVNFGFLDFTSLAARKKYCEAELKLNRRFAPEIYLDVVPITQKGELVKVDGQGEVIDYAVKMVQFDQSQLAIEILKAGHLSPQLLKQFACSLADFHGNAEIIDDQIDQAFQRVILPVQENFLQLKKSTVGQQFQERIGSIEEWSLRNGRQLKPFITTRCEQGFVRDCHGDLHLGNIVLWQDVLVPFDCIEFNHDFRRIDVMSEIAFLLMDLDDRQRPDLASLFLNAYLERTGDYAGLRLLQFYRVYRAMVRAKVDALRLQQNVSTNDSTKIESELSSFLQLAHKYTIPKPRTLTITHGFSGSGKTTGSSTFIAGEGAIRIRSDVERKRIFDIQAEQHSRTQVGHGIYSQMANEQTEQRLKELARAILQSGFSVLVDATFLKKKQRDAFRQLAETETVPFQILHFDAEPDVLRDRIRQRNKTGADASDATVHVLEHQLENHDPLTEDELNHVVKVN